MSAKTEDIDLNFTILKTNNNSNTELLTNYTRRHRLFCIIPATPSSFKSSKAFTVLNAWISKCDNYRFVVKIPVSLVASEESSLSLFLFTNVTNKTKKMAFGYGKEVKEPVNLLHPLHLFKDEYAKLTYKMFYTIKDIYLKHVGQYDWFLKGFCFNLHLEHD
jgi:hypothetical protein